MKIDAPSAKAEAPTPGAPARDPWRGRLGAHYTAATFSSGIAWQSGVRVDASFAVGRLVYFGVAYANHPERAVQRPDVTVRVGRHEANAFAGIQYEMGAFGIAADLGAGFDVLSRYTSRTDVGVFGAASSTSATPVLVARGHLRWRIPGASRLAADIAPGVELAQYARPLVVDEGATKSTLLEPYALRLHLDAGGTFDIF